MRQEGILANIAGTAAVALASAVVALTSAASALASAGTPSAPVTAGSMNFASSSPSMGIYRQ